MGYAGLLGGRFLPLLINRHDEKFNLCRVGASRDKRLLRSSAFCARTIALTERAMNI
jgi:hypothetical protein